MIKTSAPIPRDCYKYYKSTNLDEVVESGVGSLDEVNSVEIIISKVLQAADCKFLGWAMCKPNYSKTLVENGIGLVEIAQDSDGKKFLLSIDANDIRILTREYLDSLFQ